MRELLDGATAVARAALDADCTFFAGYPITPATSLLLHMVRELPKRGGIAIQAEDEIASIAMCIGASMTGARAMTATSGPGISLYSENIGLAIMGEVPLVIVDAQRMGPATGGATTVAQGDVQFVRWGTSGGYPIIALAPSSIAECYHLTLRAFELAERFRMPVFLLADKELFLSLASVDVSEFKPRAITRRVPAVALPKGSAGLRPEETFLPYAFAAADQVPGFSPLGGEHIVRFTGSTHDEHGLLTKDPEKMARLNEHLRRKVEDHSAELEMVVEDLQPDARTLFISYGVTARAMQQATAQARAEGHAVSALTVQSLWPVPEQAILRALGADTSTPVTRIIVAELNLGDFHREVERVVYRWAAQKGCPAPEVIALGRLDGKLITPDQFIEGLAT